MKLRRTVRAAAVAAVVAASTLAGGIANAASPHVEVVREFDTSAWSPPSPDPQGLVWAPRLRRLVVVDSEVDEMGIWAGANLFTARRTGALTSTSSLLPFTAEPNDIVRDPATGHFLIVSDHPRRMYEIAKGPDHRFFTSDDVVVVTNLTTGAFTDARIRDAEGLAIGAGSLWIESERDREVFRVRPGPDGRWSGDYAADNRVTHWDTRPLGQIQPEGIEFDRASGHLLIVSNAQDSPITEVNKSGRLVRTYDASIGSDSPSGLRFVPGRHGGRTLYMTDRGVDNNSDPNENDGRIFELRLVRH
jgi:hypothetical protein